MDTTSVTLLERLHQPDQGAAWARFVGLYTPLLLCWVRGLGLQEAEADDLVQDVLTTVVQKMPEFVYDPQKSFRGWLRTVTLNRWRKLRQRQAALPLESNEALLAQAVETDEHELFSEAEYRRQVLEQALDLVQNDFHPTTWKAFWEHGVLGRSAAEVAGELGLTAGAVYAAKFRVLARLRQELRGLLD